MPDNINNDYNELAKLIYPSIEASGNVYYGQTRKLAIDELFNINDGGFESSIKTIRRQTDSNEDGFEYISYFCWKFGPLNGRIRITPCDNDKFIFTFANFPELEKIYSLDDTYITNDSTDPIVGTLFIRYKLLLNDNTVEHILNSGTFNSYEKIISLDANDIRVYITDNCDPTDVDNRDIDDRNIFVKHENDAYYLFVKLCKCADFESDALYFTNINDGESTVKLIVNGDLQTDYEYYKSHITGWQKYNIGDTITLQNKNDKVYFRGTRSQQDYDNYIQFNLTGKLSVGGNINSLLSPDESVYKNITDYTTFETANGQTFYRLFFNQTSLYDASELKLRANKLSGGCYYSMFQDCTNLVKAPELPAMTLNSFCYYNMFIGCTSLTQAPELPATTLADNCYRQMFYGCTSLIQATELPATTLADGCYYSMFQDCTNLVKAPELPAMTLNSFCYFNMFIRCTSLTQAPELPATTLADNCYRQMFYGCTSLIQATELPATTLADGCYYSMFQGCTNLTQAPELPATNLADSCYFAMFSACNSLTQTPELPAAVLSGHCYYGMFYDCINLNYVKCLAVYTLATDCTFRWLGNVAATGTFECDNKKYFTLDSPNGIPVGWTITELNPDPDPEVFDPTIPFYIENIGDVPVEVGLYNHSSNTQVRINCKISYDLNTWLNYSLALAINPTDSLIGKITLTNKGDRVYIKADLDTKPSNSHYTHLTVLNSSTDTKIKARGNIASLNKGTNDAYKTNYLTADDHGYLCLFRDCASLIQAPELPATTLIDNCYDSMFYNCTSLSIPPSLPATELSGACYANMFRGCTSLVNAPTLPATTLSALCYYNMFGGCTSLIQAPELLASTLTNYSYAYMFENCTSLSYIKCAATNKSAEKCTLDWVKGVAPTGNFYKSSSATWATGTSGIPTGWISHNA